MNEYNKPNDSNSRGKRGVGKNATLNEDKMFWTILSEMNEKIY